jgi:hypothetical protein
VLDPHGKNIEAVLGRRSQFAPEPGRCFQRFHRIDKLDRALMNVIASEGSEVKAGRAGSDPCGSDPWQHRDGFALWTWWPVKNTHDVVPYIGREHDTLSHR